MGIRKFFKDLFSNDPARKASAEEQIREETKKVADFTEGVGKKVIDETKPVLDKLQKSSEEAGRVILETGREFTDKAADFTEDVGRKVLDKTAQIKENLQDSVEEIGKKILGEDLDKQIIIRKDDSTATSTGNEGKKEFVPKEDPFKKYENSHEEKSHLDALKETPGFGSGSFFDKASKFADGDYDAVKDQNPAMEIHTEKTEEAEKKPWTAPVQGFEDLDGDGDPLIDDAIIEEE